MATRTIRLGIDVGGTNTDAVLMRGRDILGTNKSFTTSDVTSGVIESVERLLADTGIPPGEVGHVMIGTTQFINAFVQRRDLVKTAIVRASLPRGDGVPPLTSWPEDLLAVIGHHVFEIHGGANYDGSTYADLDERELAEVAEILRQREIGAVAVSTTYAPLRPDIEERMAAFFRAALPSVPVTLSGAVGGLGLIDRENAAVINASLAPLARRVVKGLEDAISALGLNATLFISQNDGTLISTEEAARHPVFTCAAGPTNSIRGAAFLSGLNDAVVIDVGGTTTDVGSVTHGFPKETALPNFIGGVRTNMRMPDVLSVPLGGGTLVDLEQMSLGPASVGHRLKQEALVFGGQTLTATDVAVAAGVADIGDVASVSNLPSEAVARAMATMASIAEDAVDRIKTSAVPVPAILVGGGHILLPDQLPGIDRIVRPHHAEVANAVGAAIATVSGRVDKLYDTAMIGRDGAVEAARQEAIATAVAAGAHPETVEIIELIELPMTHIRAGTTQIKVRAVGELDLAVDSSAAITA